jgi:transcriptional regulator with XRE-family HTH domain
MPFDEALYLRFLGEELLALRNKRGWTREELRNRLPYERTAQSLAAHEQGTRRLSVVRFAQFCEVMDERPEDLLARVHERLVIGRPDQIVIDLEKVSASTDPDLAPLRVWARDKLLAAPTGSRTSHRVPIDIRTVESIALLCGLSSTELAEHIRPDDL